MHPVLAMTPLQIENLRLKRELRKLKDLVQGKSSEGFAYIGLLGQTNDLVKAHEELKIRWNTVRQENNRLTKALEKWEKKAEKVEKKGAGEPCNT